MRGAARPIAAARAHLPFADVPPASEDLSAERLRLLGLRHFDKRRWEIRAAFSLSVALRLSTVGCSVLPSTLIDEELWRAGYGGYRSGTAGRP